MKSLSILVLLAMFSIKSSSAQCIADAGPDTIICDQDLIDSIQIGGNPSTMGGVAPYTYRWYSKTIINDIHYPASSALNDTTSPNPVLLWVIGNLYLEVTDTKGNRCYDSVTHGHMAFVINLEVKKREIDLGDSLRLHTSIRGGWEPYTYKWSPSMSLEDSTKVNTWAKPTKYTNYELVITDSAGCQMTDNYVVKVRNSNITNINKPEIQFSYNTEGNSITVSIDRIGELIVYDLMGNEIHTSSLNQGTSEIQLQSISSGYYVVSINSSGAALRKKNISGQKLKIRQ